MEWITEEQLARIVAEEQNLPFVVLDPLQLDYRLVTDTFGGPFAERHLVVALEQDSNSLTLAMAEPWNSRAHSEHTACQRQRDRAHHGFEEVTAACDC